MIDIEDFFTFWQNMGFVKFIRIFWYFFVFEFTRFIMFDFIVLFFYKFNRYTDKHRWDDARKEFLKEQPLVSIIIPGKNEGRHIYKLAKSLDRQTYKNTELIIVDDGSDDDTEKICRDLERNGLIDLFLRNEVRGGKASGANLALRYSKGKYVVHLDADCSFDDDAVEKVIIPFYYDKNIAGVGGNLEVRNAKASVCTSVQAIEYLKVILTGRMVTSYLGIYRVISGAFGAFRKDVLDRLDGWDIGPGLDGDITVKIRKLGYRVHFEPTANGHTNAPDKFQKLAKQRLRWDRSIVRFRVRKHKNVFYPNEAFILKNMISSLENIFYNIVLNIFWFVYIIDIFTNHSALVWYIVPMNYILYTAGNFAQFAVIMYMTKNRLEKLRLLAYVPLMVLYTGFFLRFVRTIAHFKEFFFYESYNDPWNPSKSSDLAKKLKL
jgi:biofilm PGA synthesis N-glycosyltransferase PgaC